MDYYLGGIELLVAEERKRSSIKLPDKYNIVEHLLETHYRSRPNAPAIHLISPETLKVSRSVSYADLWKEVNRVGNALLAGNIQEEQRVAIMLNDGLEFVSTFLAALKVGSVPILLSTYLSDQQLLFLLNDSRAKALFIDSSLTSKLKAISSDIEFTRLLVSQKEDPNCTISYEELTKNSSEHLDIANTSKDDVAFWFFTSGSTGNPKGVVHLHHDLYYAGLTYYEDVIHTNANDVFLSGAKLYFSAGLGFGLYGPLIVGASTTLYSGKPVAETILKLMTNAKPTAFLGVPTLYAQMLQIMDSGSFDLSSIRIFATGGEPLSPHTFYEWKNKTGREITEAIGAAEVGHHYISNILGSARPGTCGKLMDGYEAKIVGEDGRELAVNEIGKLLVKGESTFVYYWHLHEATKRTVLGDWIDTNDLFYRDEEGYFHFCGRTDFSFKVSGLWVSPIEIENAVMETGLARECCVVSIEGSDGTSKPIAYVVPKEDNGQYSDQAPFAFQLESLLSTRLSKYKVPKKIIMVNSLQKTSVGKLDRSAILKEARSNVKI